MTELTKDHDGTGGKVNSEGGNRIKIEFQACFVCTKVFPVLSSECVLPCIKRASHMITIAKGPLKNSRKASDAVFNYQSMLLTSAFVNCVQNMSFKSRIQHVEFKSFFRPTFSRLSVDHFSSDFGSGGVV